MKFYTKSIPVLFLMLGSCTMNNASAFNASNGLGLFLDNNHILVPQNSNLYDGNGSFISTFPTVENTYGGYTNGTIVNNEIVYSLFYVPSLGYYQVYKTNINGSGNWEVIGSINTAGSVNFFGISNNKLYFNLNNSQNVIKTMDLSNGTIEDTLTLETGRYYTFGKIKNNILYISSYNNSTPSRMEIIDLSNNNNLSTISNLGPIAGILVSLNGKAFYVFARQNSYYSKFTLNNDYSLNETTQIDIDYRIDGGMGPMISFVDGSPTDNKILTCENMNGACVVFNNFDSDYNKSDVPSATCLDGIQNQDETAIDKGGTCNLLAPTMPTVASQNGTKGTEFSHSYKATDTDSPDANISYSLVSGTLPNGTSLNTSNGTVSGTPTTAGTFTFTIGVTDSVHTDSKEYSIIIAESSNNTNTGAGTVSILTTNIIEPVQLTSDIFEGTDANVNNLESIFGSGTTQEAQNKISEYDTFIKLTSTKSKISGCSGICFISNK